MASLVDRFNGSPETQMARDVQSFSDELKAGSSNPSAVFDGCVLGAVLGGRW